MDTFDIYFSGKTLPDADPQVARAGVSRLFKVEGAALDALFSGAPRRIKKGVDVDKASRYRAAFRDVGALVDIVPSGQQLPGDRPSGTVAPRTVAEKGNDAAAHPPGLQLLPPRTGSLEDCIESVEARPLPDISDLSLAEAGGVLDDRVLPPPAHYDTSALTLGPANAGSLEDCVLRKEPRPIGDISHLTLVED